MTNNTKPIADLKNTLLCGDCTQVMPTLPAASIDLIVTDPPYLVNYRPRSGQRVINDNAAHWVKPAFAEMYRLLKPDTFCLSFYGWPQVEVFMSAWKAAGFRPVSHFVWVKKYPSRTGYAASHHEVAYLLAKGRPAKPKTPLADVRRWEYTRNALHPTEKPVSAIQPFIETYCRPGDTVLDPFFGSGTTAVAAKQCGRHYFGIEQEATFCKVAKNRLDNAALTNDSYKQAH